MFGVQTKKGDGNVCQLDTKVKTIHNKSMEARPELLQRHITEMSEIFIIR